VFAHRSYVVTQGHHTWTWGIVRRQSCAAISPLVPPKIRCCSAAAVVWLCATVFLSQMLTGSSFAESKELPAPWRHEQGANAFSLNRTVPRVDHGYLFSFRRRLREGGGNNMFVRSLSTGQEAQFSFWIEGATEVRLEDAAMNGVGQIYLAGSYMRSGEIIRQK